MTSWLYTPSHSKSPLLYISVLYILYIAYTCTSCTVYCTVYSTLRTMSLLSCHSSLYIYTWYAMLLLYWDHAFLWINRDIAEIIIGLSCHMFFYILHRRKLQDFADCSQTRSRCSGTELLLVHVLSWFSLALYVTMSHIQCWQLTKPVCLADFTCAS